MNINRKTISRLLTFTLAFAGVVVPLISGAQSASADTTVKPWSALAKSIDGSMLIAGTWGKGIFISSDSGTSWVRVTPETSSATNASSSTDISTRCYTDFIWTSVAISNDGETLVGGTFGCGLWVSIDGGTSWRQRSTTSSGKNAIDSNWKWYSVALSADATKVYGVNNQTGLEGGFTNSSSSLRQLTWSAGDSNIGSADPTMRQIHVTSDGSLFGKNDTLKFYKITVNLTDFTYGQTQYNPNGSTNFWVGAMEVINTGDSFTIYAAQGNQAHGKIAVSRNSGSTWSLLENSPQKLWLRISASQDGRKLIGIASYDNGEIFLKSTSYSHLWISTDSGNSWTNPLPVSGRHWSEVKVLPDGSFMATDGQETPFYVQSFVATSPSWNPVPTISGQDYSGTITPRTGNIWKSDSSGGNWAITDPTIYGGPSGRTTLTTSDTTTSIYDPDRSLGQPKLSFASVSPGATVTVTPTTDPTSGSNSPFMVGAKILDISVVGVSGNTEICVDGSSTERMWHYRSNAWEDITTSHTSTQVCGTTSSFSPFAIGAPAPSTRVDAAAAAKAAMEARARKVESARKEILNALASEKTITVLQLQEADFDGATSKNIALINRDIAKLSPAEKQNLKQLERIVMKYVAVDKVSEGKPFYASDLIAAGIISADSKIKTAIISTLKKQSRSAIDSLEKIQSIVAAVEKKEADRKARLEALLAKRR